MLVVEGLRARVGDFMLGPLDVRVAPGCVHAVLGPSGAGKSSLLACLLGAQPATADRLSLDGHEIGGLPIERRGIGFVPQRPSLFPHLNVREQLWYGVRARRLPADAAAAAIDRLVAVSGIAALLDRRPDALSGGEAQRVALVRALAAQPRLLLLDEPLSAVDAGLRRELLGLIRAVVHELGVPALLVTHAVQEALALAGTASVLVRGRVVQEGELAALCRRPVDSAIARLLGFDNVVPARIVARREGQVVLAIGRWTCAVPDAGLAGPQVVAALRAEALQVQVAGAGSQPAAVVREALALGSSWELLLDAAVPLWARVSRRSLPVALSPGTAVTLTVDAEGVALMAS